MRGSTASAVALAFGTLAAAAPQNAAIDRRDGWGGAMTSLKHYWGFNGGGGSSPDYTSTSYTTVVVDMTSTVWEGSTPTDTAETTIRMHSTVTNVITVPYPTSTGTADVYESSASVASSTYSSVSATAKATSESVEIASTTSQDIIGGTVTGGEATYYGGDLSGGTCSFTDYTIPSGLYGTAFSLPSWDAAANCGACVRITGPSGNNITAMVVDACGSCASNHLDLFPDAFSELADQSEGIISIDYTWVKCGIDTPIILHNKDGVSEYWFSMQVVNSNEPITTLEVSTDGGSTWESTTRQEYNFFEKSSGFGTSTVDVRVTAQSGKTITVSNVEVASEARTTGTSNF